MATPPLSLLLFVFSLLSIASTTIAEPHILSHSEPTTDFIRASCRSTQYPYLCYHCLSGYANEIQHSERQLALTALAVSLARARSTALFVSNMTMARGINHREFEAVKDCVETMGDTVDQLRRSIKELGHVGHMDDQDFMWHMSNVQTWVSAALTNENTCVDGFSGNFMGGKLKAAINKRVTNVAQVTSNALALVNNFASSHLIEDDVKYP